MARVSYTECDRCKKRIEERDFATVKIFYPSQTTTKDYDLCESCINSFTQWRKQSPAVTIDEWNYDRAYKKGDLVLWAGFTYRCRSGISRAMVPPNENDDRGDCSWEPI